MALRIRFLTVPQARPALRGPTLARAHEDFRIGLFDVTRPGDRAP